MSRFDKVHEGYYIASAAALAVLAYIVFKKIIFVSENKISVKTSSPSNYTGKQQVNDVNKVELIGKIANYREQINGNVPIYGTIEDIKSELQKAEREFNNAN